MSHCSITERARAAAPVRGVHGKPGRGQGERGLGRAGAVHGGGPSDGGAEGHLPLPAARAARLCGEKRGQLGGADERGAGAGPPAVFGQAKMKCFMYI